MNESSEMQGRGYVLAATVSFLNETVGPTKAQEIFQRLSPELQHVVQNVQPAGFYPIPLFAELNRAVVEHLAGADDEKGREVLLQCGRHTGREASNTFLKLLMKILTPGLIVKKLPDFWRRDFNFGRIEVQTSQRGLQCFMFEMPGYAHICPLSAGWQQFNLEAMGKTIEKTVIHKWSVQEPWQEGTSFEIVWKA